MSLLFFGSSSPLRCLLRPHNFHQVGPTHILPAAQAANSHLICHKRKGTFDCAVSLFFSCAVSKLHLSWWGFKIQVDDGETFWRQEKDEEELAWPPKYAHIISKLAQCFTNAMVGSRSWVGGIFSRSGNKRSGSNKFIDYSLNPLQEHRLQRLQERLQVSFDETCPDHQEALKTLWRAAFPDIALKGLKSEQWKDMGWQGSNPSTDFRGCGFISLENLLFFARTYPASFHRLLFKQGGVRATWEYPFAVAGINISFMLIQMLDLYSGKPRCLPGINFVKLLEEDEEAFDVLYCIAFEMMDAQWLAMHASYMEFNEVLQATRVQLERELSLEDVHQIQDLPAYNLLYK